MVWIVSRPSSFSAVPSSAAQRHHLARHPRGGFRQGMGAQRAGRGRIQPHQPPAHARLGDIERQNEVARGGGKGLGLFGHGPYMAANGFAFNRINNRRPKPRRFC